MSVGVIEERATSEHYIYFIQFRIFQSESHIFAIIPVAYWMPLQIEHVPFPIIHRGA